MLFCITDRRDGNPNLLKVLIWPCSQTSSSPFPLPHFVASDTIELLTAPANVTDDVHIDKSDGHVSGSAVTLSAEITSSLEKLSHGFCDAALTS